MALKQFKVEIIYDPYKYLLLIVGFYQRIVPLFLYVFQCCFYLKDLSIGNIGSCYSCVGGECSMDYRHYRVKNIFVDKGDEEMEVELESLRETGVGRLQ